MSAQPSWAGLMREGRAALAEVPAEDVMRDLRALAAHALEVPPARLTLHLHEPVPPQAAARFAAYVAARKTHMPVSKIIGQRSFWGRSFTVNEDVLDPRGDTETLIAACLDLPPACRVLDLGTGSGAIGLTLATEWPEAQVICTDISEAALRVAARNAEGLDVAGRVRLIRSDWYENVTGAFDLIVSNPPYIALGEWEGLDREVRAFDPRVALTDEGDGLGAYRAIIADAPAHLTPGGALVLEIGWTQAADVGALCTKAGFDAPRVLPDLAGRDRCVIASMPL